MTENRVPDQFSTAPWGIFGHAIRDYNGQFVAVAISADNSDEADRENAANLRLIVAAPQMLEALRSAHERLYEHDLCLCSDVNGGAHCEIWRAIAAATGEQP